MLSPFTRLIAIAILMMLFLASKAQTRQNLRGIVFQQGSGMRVGNAAIHIKNTIYTFKTNNLGEFSIPVSAGDTLEISHHAYEAQEFVVKDYADVFLYLQAYNLLPEVVIQRSSIPQGLRETENRYRSKGIYFKGKPPLALLSPLGGSPLTFFYELLSKEGKDARRFDLYATRTGNYYEVSARFNDAAIKRMVKISDEEIAPFKSAYWPTAEQIRSWTDFDLYSYIRKSFEEFKKAGKSP